MLSCVTDSETFDLLSTVEFDQEGGLPIKMNIEELNIAGFHSNPEENWGYFKFIAPVTLIGSPFRAKPVVSASDHFAILQPLLQAQRIMLKRLHFVLAAGWSGQQQHQQQEAAWGHDSVLLHPGVSGKMQGHLGERV